MAKSKLAIFKFNKTNFVHFTAKRNVSVNLNIGFNNNFISNSSYTKFLVVTMNNTLSCNNHIDLLMKRLSKACYIIRNAQIYMSASSLKVISYAFFHSAMCYGIIFWGNLLHSTITFRIEENVIRIMEGCENRVLCRNLCKKLQIVPLTSQHTLFLLMFIVQNKTFFSTNYENHNLDTRQRNSLYLPQANLTIYQKGAYYSRIKIFTVLPLEITNVAGNKKKIKLLSEKLLYT